MFDELTAETGTGAWDSSTETYGVNEYAVAWTEAVGNQSAASHS